MAAPDHASTLSEDSPCTGGGVHTWPCGTAATSRVPRPAVSPGHGGRGPGLVDEHQPLRAQRRLLEAPGGPGRGDVRAVLLGGVLGLFFRVSPAAMRKRPTPDRLVAIPSSASRCRSSAIVRSGSAATSARRRSPCAASVDCFQPPIRSGWIVPRWCQRGISLTTKLMLTSNLGRGRPPRCPVLDRAHHPLAQIHRIRVVPSTAGLRDPAVSLNRNNRTL
jgi:hypothetical protein